MARRSEARAKQQREAILQGLLETLTWGMAAKAYQCRHGKPLPDEEMDEFMDELVREHYDAGLSEWSDEYLYWD